MPPAAAGASCSVFASLARLSVMMTVHLLLSVDPGRLEFRSQVRVLLGSLYSSTTEVVPRSQMTFACLYFSCLPFPE